MSITKRTINAAPERVFAVLSDGWTYSDWVVGTVHIRDVDAAWPQVGSRLHHKAGPWPFSLKDTTTVTAVDPDTGLTLRAGLWPLGEAMVQLRLERVGPERTRVVMREEFESGPLVGLRNKINDVVLHRRNAEALSRLADLAEGRRSTSSG